MAHPPRPDHYSHQPRMSIALSENDGGDYETSFNYNNIGNGAGLNSDAPYYQPNPVAQSVFAQHGQPPQPVSMYHQQQQQHHLSSFYNPSTSTSMPQAPYQFPPSTANADSATSFSSILPTQASFEQPHVHYAAADEDQYDDDDGGMHLAEDIAGGGGHHLLSQPSLDDLEERERMIRRRSSKACDGCRKSRCKCEPGQTVERCKNCELTNIDCTYLGPSRKRGPPKGYIDAIQTHLQQLEALVGVLVTTNDPRVVSFLDDLRKASAPYRAARHAGTSSIQPSSASPAGSSSSTTPVDGSSASGTTAYSSLSKATTDGGLIDRVLGRIAAGPFGPLTALERGVVSAEAAITGPLPVTSSNVGTSKTKGGKLSVGKTSGAKKGNGIGGVRSSVTMPDDPIALDGYEWQRLLHRALDSSNVSTRSKVLDPNYPSKSSSTDGGKAHAVKTEAPSPDEEVEAALAHHFPSRTGQGADAAPPARRRRLDGGSTAGGQTHLPSVLSWPANSSVSWTVAEVERRSMGSDVDEDDDDDDDEEAREVASGVGLLSIDDAHDVRYHGRTSGLHLLHSAAADSTESKKSGRGRMSEVRQGPHISKVSFDDGVRYQPSALAADTTGSGRQAHDPDVSESDEEDDTDDDDEDDEDHDMDETIQGVQPHDISARRLSPDRPKPLKTNMHGNLWYFNPPKPISTSPDSPLNSAHPGRGSSEHVPATQKHANSAGVSVPGLLLPTNELYPISPLSSQHDGIPDALRRDLPSPGDRGSYRSGSAPPLRDTAHKGPRRVSYEEERMPVSSKLLLLPSEPLQEKLLDIFFTHIYPNLPIVLSKQSFMQMWRDWLSRKSSHDVPNVQNRSFGPATRGLVLESAGSTSASSLARSTSMRALGAGEDDGMTMVEELAKKPHDFSIGVLFAMFACAARYMTPEDYADEPMWNKPEERWEGWTIGLQWADHCREIIFMSRIPARASTVQLLVLLGYMDVGNGAMQSAWHTSGLAVRAALDAGLNRPVDHWLGADGQVIYDEADREVCRRAWYCTLLMETYLTTYIGRPCSVGEGDFDTPLPGISPEDRELWSALHHDPIPPIMPDVRASTKYMDRPSNAIECFRARIELNSITDKVMRQLYAVKQLPSVDRWSAAERLQTRLEKWYHDLPESLAYACALVQISPPPHVVILHMNYQCTVLLCNRPLIAVKQSARRGTPKTPDSESGSPASSTTKSNALRAFAICEGAANRISGMAQSYHSNFTVSRGSAFLPYYVFTAAIMHLTILRDSPSDVQAATWLEKDIQFLGTLGTVMPTAARARDLLHGARKSLRGISKIDNKLGSRKSQNSLKRSIEESEDRIKKSNPVQSSASSTSRLIVESRRDQAQPQFGFSYATRAPSLSGHTVVSNAQSSFPAVPGGQPTYDLWGHGHQQLPAAVASQEKWSPASGGEVNELSNVADFAHLTAGMENYSQYQAHPQAQQFWDQVSQGHAMNMLLGPDPFSDPSALSASLYSIPSVFGMNQPGYPEATQPSQPAQSSYNPAFAYTASQMGQTYPTH